MPHYQLPQTRHIIFDTFKQAQSDTVWYSSLIPLSVEKDTWQKHKFLIINASWYKGIYMQKEHKGTTVYFLIFCSED